MPILRINLDRINEHVTSAKNLNKRITLKIQKDITTKSPLG